MLRSAKMSREGSPLYKYMGSSLWGATIKDNGFYHMRMSKIDCNKGNKRFQLLKIKTSWSNGKNQPTQAGLAEPVAQ